MQEFGKYVQQLISYIQTNVSVREYVTQSANTEVIRAIVDIVRHQSEETILSVCYLASNAAVQNERVKLQIVGQRSVEYGYRFAEICKNPVLYKIYDWIHSGGSSIDKAIIARNIICLHCKYESPLNMDEGVLASLQSSYNLYLKDNVTQYLELKSKIAEFISDIVSRTGKYAIELLDRLKKSVNKWGGISLKSALLKYDNIPNQVVALRLYILTAPYTD